MGASASEGQDPVSFERASFVFWPEKANGTEALSEEVERLQPEINAYRQQLVKTFLDGTVQYLRQHSWRVAARVRDEESESLFEDDMMEDIRLTCQEYPQQRMGGTRIGAEAPQNPAGWVGGTDVGTRIESWRRDTRTSAPATPDG